MDTAILIIALLNTICSQQNDWKEYKDNLEEKYIEWCGTGKDTRENYLNYELNKKLDIKNRKDLHKVIYLIAMYHEWNAEPPRLIKSLICSRLSNLKSIQIFNSEIMLCGLIVTPTDDSLPDMINKPKIKYIVTPLNLQILERKIMDEIKLSRQNQNKKEIEPIAEIVDEELQVARPPQVFSEQEEELEIED